jgi:polar amino acid transport system substrate-binding protein
LGDAIEAPLLTIPGHDLRQFDFVGVWMRVVSLVLGLLAALLGMGGWVAHGLADQPALRLACNDFPPHKIEHPGEDGLAGFDVDIVTEAMQRIGRSVAVSFMPWKRALEMVERGTYDGLCSCSYMKERAATLVFSGELGAVSAGLFARTEGALAGISSIADLKGRKVATVGGYNLESELIKAGADVQPTSSDKNALDMLVAGKVDLLYGYQLTTQHFIASDPRSRSIAYKEMKRNPYYFCLSRALPGAEATMQGFNRSLSEMAKDGSIDRILARYHVTFR